MVKSYTITSADYLDMKKNEIITLCKLHNARAYINLNKRSFEKCAYHSMKKLTDVILAKSFGSAKKVFDSVASAHSADKEKKWLIDVDDMEFPSPLMMAHIEHNCKPYDPDKIIGVIKTLNGCHLITKPFNIVQFREKYPDVEVKKNSPTLLYYSK
jgi:(p)ppGpp synthase/HD superfamily hydrolase